MERKTKTRKTRARRVKKGYETLAFGGIEDAVRLLFCEDLKPEDLEGLDLYNVAEIRRPRGGGMEIKFFDRHQGASMPGTHGDGGRATQPVRSFGSGRTGAEQGGTG